MTAASPRKSRRIRQQDDLNRLPSLMQLPRRHKSIAAVVALAAENHDLLHRAIMREHMLRHGRPGIFHQRKRRHAEALAGGAVDGAHFRRSHNFHAIPIFMMSKSSRLFQLAQLRGFAHGDQAIVGLDPLIGRGIEAHALAPLDGQHNHSALLPDARTLNRLAGERDAGVI